VEDADRVQEILQESLFQTNRIYPIYPQLQGIKSAWFAKKVRENKDHIPGLFPEFLPDVVLKECNLMEYSETVKNMHYPLTMEDAEVAHRRVSFDKLL
jgi:RecG-like helicase